MKKNITYWKCQFIGWGIFEIASYIYASIYPPNKVNANILSNLPRFILIYFINILLSHFLRYIIQRFKVFVKTFAYQIFFALVSTIILSAIRFMLYFLLYALLLVFNNVPGIIRSNDLAGLYQSLFFISISSFGWNLIYFGYHYVQRMIKEEQQRAADEKLLWELEALALRAQMNPHFIFNCMNSIKALIQEKEKEKSVTYLTTFSELLRTLFQNSDKREVTLYDEIETCRLYMQLESMRFANKFSYQFNIEEQIDLTSLMIPALIVQPFIENAIWHGIMPKENGGTLAVSITKKDNVVSCIIEDDGVGRETSKQNKFKGEQSTHQSKGVHLTQTRLDLNNALNQRNATLEILDKKDVDGKSSGTKIILTFGPQAS